MTPPRRVGLGHPNYDRLIVVDTWMVGKRRWCRCNCKCGSQKICLFSNVVRGLTRSCGCYQKERASESHKTHGESRGSGRRLYTVWKGMNARCYRSNHTAYHLYGGRGITVCDEWRASYEAFKLWALANGYRVGLTIDRKENHLGYSPENCRVADWQTQQRNRRNNHTLTMNGETRTVAEWSEHVGIEAKTLYARCYMGWPDERTLTTPARVLNKMQGVTP